MILTTENSGIRPVAHSDTPGQGTRRQIKHESPGSFESTVVLTEAQERHLIEQYAARDLAETGEPISTRKRSYYNPKARKQDAEKTAERLSVALDRYPTRAASVRSYRTAADIRTGREASYASVYAPAYLRRHLWQAMGEPIQTRSDLRKVTLLDRRWITDISAWDWRVGAIKSLVRQALGPMSAVFFIECAIFPNEKSSDGFPSAAFHVEGIGWGPWSDSLRKKAAALLEPGLHNARPLVQEAIYDLRGAVTYCVKHPYAAHRLYRNADGHRVHRSGDLSHKLMQKVWAQFRHVYWTEIVFGVNEGKAIAAEFRDLTRRCADRRQCCLGGELWRLALQRKAQSICA